MMQPFAYWTLVVLLGATVGGTIAQAQEGDDACEVECAERQQQCLETCGEHDDPIECESDCDDDAGACRNACR